MSDNKVKFWRGVTHKDPESSSNGEIIVLNDAYNATLTKNSADYNKAKAFGSIYQDDKIVGTTRATELKTTADIMVAGGPLADDVNTNWPTDTAWTVGGVPTIPAGSSLLDILEKLFLKPKDGTATWGTASWTTTPSWAKPSITLSNTTVEVGTSLSVSWSAGTKSKGKYSVTCDCDCGYFLSNGDDAEWNSGDYVHSVDGVLDGKGSVTAKWNSVVTTANTVKTKEGSNTFAVYQSGESSTGTLSSKTLYPSTNTKKLIDEASTFNGGTNTKSLSSENSVSLNSYYKYFYWTGSTAPESIETIPTSATSSWLTGCTSGATTSNTSKITVPAGTQGTQYGYILIPDSFVLEGIQTDIGSAGKNDWTLRASRHNYVLPDDSTVQYKVYYFSNDGDGTPIYKNMVFKKI